MPTYQYACTACGEQLEVVQKFSDEPLTECPTCAGRLRKIFSAVGVVFKGSGFYRTDSRSASSAGSGDKATTGGTTSEKSAEKKAEAAPAKAETKPAAKSGDSKVA